MPQASIQEVAQLLRSRIGTRWEGPKEDGQHEMVRVLEDELTFTRQQANDAIDALVGSGEFSYHMQQQVGDRVLATDAPPDQSPSIIAAPYSGGGMPVPLELDKEVGGYWRLGRDSSDATGHESVVGRAGQIDPTA